MTSRSVRKTMVPQSSELAGGEGFTYEGDAAAFYLAALLAEAYAPGIEARVVHGVAVQQRDFGEPLDDVIVDFRNAAGDLARLSLQVKRSLTISKAPSNSDFRDIIRDSWATLAKPDFREGIDRYGAAVGTVTAAKARAITTLCELARESPTTDHFDARFAPGGNAGPPVKTIKQDVAALLDETNGSPCSSAQVHRFLAHFVLIEFDFLHEGAADPPAAITRIRDCSPFTSTYVCAYIFDAEVVPEGTVSVLNSCLGRFLACPELERTSYRSGQFTGFDQPRLARTLMFVSVERADLAARYVNGDWTEIAHILPLVDRYVRAAGWAASVMGPFLTLCERATANYPAEAFADQILSIIGCGNEDLKGWHGSSLPARIAGLVQHFADRDSPLPLHLAQKFLRILDIQIDMGDRRSAALQFGEVFREVRIAP